MLSLLHWNCSALEPALYEIHVRKILKSFGNIRHEQKGKEKPMLWDCTWTQYRNATFCNVLWNLFVFAHKTGWHNQNLGTFCRSTVGTRQKIRSWAIRCFAFSIHLVFELFLTPTAQNLNLLQTAQCKLMCFNVLFKEFAGYSTHIPLRLLGCRANLIVICSAPSRSLLCMRGRPSGKCGDQFLPSWCV
jgi:hypothetical protein